MPKAYVQCAKHSKYYQKYSMEFKLCKSVCAFQICKVCRDEWSGAEKNARTRFAIHNIFGNNLSAERPKLTIETNIKFHC